ncbi:MAG: TIGR01212 family radical SAM protein [Marinilabiliales bacterium]|nr:MAG: TIGR01212 family radical SAM protein [Marinilabiliales bacterium]
MYPWGHHRPYNSYAQYFERTFGERVQKTTIDAGFTCPNRDGTVARGGCTYCNNNAFNPSYNDAKKPVEVQIKEGIEFHANRYRRAKKFLAYFQAYSNTYAPLEELKQIYGPALETDGVIGLVIGTRSDCMDEEKLKYFADIQKTHYVIIEYGIESTYNKTLERINRGHDFQNVVDMLHLTKEYGIKTGGHMIFGLPGESRQEMLDQVYTLNELPLDNIKFHQLQIIKGTHMAKEFKEAPQNFNLFGMEEYIDFVVRFLEKLNPNFVVERFAGEVPPRFLVSEGWGKIRYDQISNAIEKKLIAENTWQGRLFQ